MIPLVFLGGVVAGAVGFAAIALRDKKRPEARNKPEWKKPNQFDPVQIARQLNSFFFKAQELYSKCNEVTYRVCDLIPTPIFLPDDDFLQKAANILGGSANRFCRGQLKRELNEIGEEAINLFSDYSGTFHAANEMLASRGESGIELSKLETQINPMHIDSSLENDDWELEIENYADSIRDKLEELCSAAETLIDRLDKGKEGDIIELPSQ